MTTPIPAGWKPIESAPKNQLVMVYTPPQPSDWPDTVRISFDYIDPEVADDYWYNHGEHYEHYCCVAKPENCTGPQERAPYTHWMPLPAAPGTDTPEDPITVALDPDPRGVSVGVWQGPHCIYTGAHAVPVAPGDAQDERKPLFWYRPRSDDGYEGPIHNDRIEEVRKQSGAWVPLYPGFATLPKPLSDLRYHGEFIRGWNQCLREVSASVAAPAAGDALPTIKGAAITGGYVVVTPAGWGEDKPQKVRDAILRLFPVNPAYTPKPETAFATQQGKGGEA